MHSTLPNVRRMQTHTHTHIRAQRCRWTSTVRQFRIVYLFPLITFPLSSTNILPHVALSIRFFSFRFPLGKLARVSPRCRPSRTFSHQFSRLRSPGLLDARALSSRDAHSAIHYLFRSLVSIFADPSIPLDRPCSRALAFAARAERFANNFHNVLLIFSKFVEVCVGIIVIWYIKLRRRLSKRKWKERWCRGCGEAGIYSKELLFGSALALDENDMNTFDAFDIPCLPPSLCAEKVLVMLAFGGKLSKNERWNGIDSGDDTERHVKSANQIVCSRVYRVSCVCVNAPALCRHCKELAFDRKSAIKQKWTKGGEQMDISHPTTDLLGVNSLFDLKLFSNSFLAASAFACQPNDNAQKSRQNRRKCRFPELGAGKKKIKRNRKLRKEANQSIFLCLFSCDDLLGQRKSANVRWSELLSDQNRAAIHSPLSPPRRIVSHHQAIFQQSQSQNRTNFILFYGFDFLLYGDCFLQMNLFIRHCRRAQKDAAKSFRQTAKPFSFIESCEFDYWSTHSRVQKGEQRAVGEWEEEEEKTASFANKSKLLKRNFDSVFRFDAFAGLQQIQWHHFDCATQCITLFTYLFIVLMLSLLICQLYLFTLVSPCFLYVFARCTQSISMHKPTPPAHSLLLSAESEHSFGH